MKATIGLGCFNILFKSNLNEEYIPELIASLPNHGYNPNLETVIIEIFPMCQIRFSNTDYLEINENLLNLSPDISRKYFRHKEKRCDLLFIDTPKITAQRNFEERRLLIFSEGTSALSLVENIMETFLANYLFSSGLLPCHGGVLIKDGSGIAFLGSSGSGKSTTLVQLLCQSEGILSNDFFYVDLQSRIAYSMDKSIAVRPSVQPDITLFQRTLNKKGLLLYRRDQSYFDAELYFGERFIMQASISAFLFCHITQIDTPTVVKLDFWEAMKHYMEHMIVPSTLAIDKNQLIQIFHHFYKLFPIYELKIPDFSKMNIPDNLFDKRFLDQVLLKTKAKNKGDQ